jgi:hypothetical protein
MYTLEELKEGEKFAGVRITSGGRTVVELKGGVSLVVSTQYAAMDGGFSDNASRDAFLSGIVLAMSHCAITGQVPVAMVG